MPRFADAIMFRFHYTLMSRCHIMLRLLLMLLIRMPDVTRH